MQIQIIDYDSFSRRQIVLPHISPHIKIRVTEGVFLLVLDSIEGGGRVWAAVRQWRVLVDDLIAAISNSVCLIKFYPNVF